MAIGHLSQAADFTLQSMLALPGAVSTDGMLAVWTVTSTTGEVWPDPREVSPGGEDAGRGRTQEITVLTPRGDLWGRGGDEITRAAWPQC